MRTPGCTPYPDLMGELAVTRRPVGACPQCGGVLAAAHMLTKTYEIDQAGHWERRLSDFVEDVVVVCRTCGTQQEGRIDEDGCSFVFLRRASIE